MKLYHGSRTGIHGEILPISRERCDFGSGFYMGTEKMQPLTLFCDVPDAVLYEVELDFEGLSILELKSDLDWALLIASLSALRLGKQYVAITDKGCSQIEIIESHVLTDEDRETLQEQSRINRSEGVRLADEIAKQYRREGRFFDEILKVGDTNA